MLMLWTLPPDDEAGVSFNFSLQPASAFYMCKRS
jgi:hypothetical protein